MPFVRFNGIPMHWTLRSAKVRGLAADDINADGKPEIIVGTGSMHVHCLDASGEELWRTDVPSGMRWTYGIPDTIVTGDVFGDGKRHAVVGNGLKSYSAYATVLGENGDIMQQYKNGGWAISLPALAVGDIDGNGEPEVYCGNNLGHVRSFRGVTGSPERKQMWWQALGRIVRAFAIVPVDGHSLLVAGSDSGYLVAFDAEGSRAWGTPLSSAIVALETVTQPDGSSRIAALCKDGHLFFCDADGAVLGVYNAAARGQALTSADINADGQPDLCIATRNPHRLIVVQQ
jgi:outer membrane protein assembly factor BamB